MEVNLNELSNVGLIEHADRAVGEEHSSGLRILEALVELERRSLHLEEGYSSLFDYCTRRWCYSPSKAGRYIAAARAMVRHPELRRLLEDGQLTICGAARIASALNAGDSEELLRSVAGKTFAEIDELVARRRVAPRSRDRVRPVGVRPAATGDSAPSGAAGLLPSLVPTSDSAAAPPGTSPGTSPGAPPAAPPATSPAASPGTSASPLETVDSQHGSREAPAESSEQLRYEVRFFASREFVDKLERAKAVCSVRGDLESVIGAALDQLLERQDPERREARRAKRLEGGAKDAQSAALESIGGDVRTPGTDVSEFGEGVHTTGSHVSDSGGGHGSRGGTNGPGRRGRTQAPSRKRAGSARPRSRHIPAKTRDAVFVRDGGCCSYVGKSGKRCGSRRFLQIDHVLPFSLGGGHEVDNLRLLCGRHNRLEAERVLGNGGRSVIGGGGELRTPSAT